jgi:replicative DNA helicase
MSNASTSSARGQAGPGDNGHAYEGYALAIVRLIRGHKITLRTRKALPPEWGSLAEYVEQSAGLTGEALWKRVRDQYLINLGTRQKKTAKDLLDALTAAWAKVEAEDPGDETEAEPERRPFVCRIKGMAEFIREDFRLEWAVKQLLIFDQPAVVGAPKKTMKTSTMVDLVVSLAAGVPFLGEFEIPNAVSVLLISGESGGFILQETINRVCRAKEINPVDLDGFLFIGDELPQLGLDEDMEALAEFIRENKIRVVVIDPLYLCLLQGSPGRRLDPGNLFDVGPLLLAISRTCLDAGATPVLVHHFRKNGADPHDLPELEELAYAGIQEFARQWILLKRRERFVPGSGVHRLWLAVGGSAGHSGEWAMDIEEGSMGDDFLGRRWDVTVKPASEARSDDAAAKEATKTEKADRKAKEQAEARERDDARDVVNLVGRLKTEPDRRATMRRIRNLTGWRDDKAGRITTRAEKLGLILPCMVPAPNGTGGVKEWPGYVFSDNPEVPL